MLKSWLKTISSDNKHFSVYFADVYIGEIYMEDGKYIPSLPNPEGKVEKYQYVETAAARILEESKNELKLRLFAQFEQAVDSGLEPLKRFRS
jgi:hypothetical protein